MGASTRDIFGAAKGAEPAAPDSYGQPPRTFRLPAETRLGRVSLQVSDLARSLAFYERTLGFRVLRRDASHVALAPQGDDTVLVELVERRGATPVPRRGRTGLYHFAILLPDRASLGRFVQHLAAIGARAGSADHLVSEAVYLQDPDNLGIEVYADRPRSGWQRVGRELMMATDPLDVEGLVAAAGAERWTGMPAGTAIGHVHLHVGDIAKASAFYSEGIGFDRMVWSYPGALFLGAGGYHHHLGTNTWAGADARPPAAHEAQLLEWTIAVPDADTIDAIAKSLAAGGFKTERDPGASSPGDALTRDPWATRIRITSVGNLPADR